MLRWIPLPSPELPLSWLLPNLSPEPRLLPLQSPLPACFLRLSSQPSFHLLPLRASQQPPALLMQPDVPRRALTVPLQPAASPPPDPPEDARQSPASVAELLPLLPLSARSSRAEPPQSQEPGVAAAQSFSSPALASPPLAWAQLESPAQYSPPLAWQSSLASPEPAAPPVELPSPPVPPLAAQPDASPVASSRESASRYRRACEPATSRSSASHQLHAVPRPRRSRPAPSECACAHARLHPSRSSSNASSFP
jgi:hypothetical protein